MFGHCLGLFQPCTNIAQELLTFRHCLHDYRNAALAYVVLTQCWWIMSIDDTEEGLLEGSVKEVL